MTWSAVISEEDVATLCREAKFTVPFLNHHGRSYDDVYEHTCRGLIVEYVHNARHARGSWWVEHRSIVMGSRYDGGHDSFDKKNVKSVVSGNRFVHVNGSDKTSGRSTDYIAYEWNEHERRVTEVGKFTYDECCELPNGCFGIEIEKIKEKQR